ncbi:MAG: DUF4215 domain-containing protein [Deltaproteobacteria bacterium]|nr:DUF4215 domain-containing protein [Deltaproteobacteria bacterium]
MSSSLPTPLFRALRQVVAAWVATVGLLFALPATAAVPGTMLAEGVLLTAGGGPATDGAYKVTASIYAAQTGGAASWSEADLQVQVQGGRFALILGSKTPLDGKLLDGTRYLGVQVGSDPELPRQPLHATAFALRAGLADGLSCTGCVAGAAVGFNYAGSASKGGPALDLACTGCVGVAEMKFDADVDLGGNALKAGSGTFTGNLVAKTMTATSYVGDGSKLTGIKSASGTCASGQAVTGIAADGAVICKPVSAEGATKLLGGMLGNAFTDTVAGGAGMAIPDNSGATASSEVKLPALGKATAVRVHLQLANTNLGAVKAVLLPPGDKKVGITLCDPCGDKDAKALDTIFPDKTAPKSGDFAALAGVEVEGSWTLVVTDTEFCIKQAPGNATLCDLDAKTDGSIVAFSVGVDTVAANKVGLGGLLQLQRAAAAPADCDGFLVGAIYYDTTVGGPRYCDGKAWRTLADTCGNGIVEGTEECDDGNNADGDGCSSTCVAAYGAVKTKPGKSCLDILTERKKLGDALQSGTYWIQPKSTAFAVHCDMETDGGGFTMCSTDNGEVHIATELSSNVAYGSDGYRADCRDLTFSEVLYVRHDNGDKAWFARDGGSKTTAAANGYSTSGDKLGTWSAKGGKASGSWKYQLLICDGAWMWTGFFISGIHPSGCIKACNSWCGDQTTHYYRYDGDNGGSYNGVSFAENGHTNVAAKLMSVGLR